MEGDLFIAWINYFVLENTTDCGRASLSRRESERKREERTTYIVFKNCDVELVWISVKESRNCKVIRSKNGDELLRYHKAKIARLSGVEIILYSTRIFFTILYTCNNISWSITIEEVDFEKLYLEVIYMLNAVFSWRLNLFFFYVVCPNSRI